MNKDLKDIIAAYIRLKQEQSYYKALKQQRKEPFDKDMILIFAFSVLFVVAMIVMLYIGCR